MRLIALCLGLTLACFGGAASAQVSPLIAEAPSTYARAQRNMFAELEKGKGAADLKYSVDLCYSIVGFDLKKAQYCYALHRLVSDFDRGMIQQAGGRGNTPGFGYVEVIGKMAVVCRRLSYEPDQCGIMLRDWREAWGE